MVDVSMGRLVASSTGYAGRVVGRKGDVVSLRTVEGFIANVHVLSCFNVS